MRTTEDEQRVEARSKARCKERKIVGREQSEQQTQDARLRARRTSIKQVRVYITGLAQWVRSWGMYTMCSTGAGRATGINKEKEINIGGAKRKGRDTTKAG